MSPLTSSMNLRLLSWQMAILIVPTLLRLSSTFSQFSSVAVVSNSLQPHGLQHARFPCPSPTPGACSNSCPLSQWCHSTISPSVIPFSSCLQSFPASESFQGVSSLHQVAEILGFQFQHQPFQWIFRTNFLSDWLVWSPWSPIDLLGVPLHLE